MNLSTHLHSQAPRRGVALVIVLSMLVLMSAILVAFMGSVSTERASQRAAYSGFEAQLAAESAVNLVMSQIRMATRDDSGEVGWASQPGVIRTFKGSGNTNGMVFKLYSSDIMQVATPDYDPSSINEAGIDPGSPLDTPAGFVNLNQPVLTPGTDADSLDPHYPIVDPRAALSRTGGTAAPGMGRVEGFWAPQTMKHVSRKKDSQGVDIMELPMRVRWLYQLKDGTLMAMDRATKRIPGASKDNPPVARVAFWTDDESSKININTAGENTFWDTPMASCYNESGNALSQDVIYNPSSPSANLAAGQPLAGEYQRYPGHPATTNLSPALRWLYKPATATTANDWEFKEAIYRLTPRYVSGWATSMAATRALFDPSTDTKTRIPKRDRLFATLDEFWFRPDRSPISRPGYFGVFAVTSATPKPDQTTVDNTAVTPQALEQLRFFLTATSRAPELNLFGLPRVCIWPVHELDDPNPQRSKRTGYDDLIAFCSTINGKPYYFTRKDPWSPTYDWMQSGNRPATGQNFIGRNRALLFGNPGGSDGYLQRLGQRPIPGVGNSFATKYGAITPASAGYTDWERLLLSIYDYVRSTNLVDTGRKIVSGAPTDYTLSYTAPYVKNPVNASSYGSGVKNIMGSGQVVPSVAYVNGQPAIKGFGRFVSPSEIALLFYRDNAPLPGDTSANPTPATDADVRCVLLTEMYSVSPGYPALSEAYAYKVREVRPLTVTVPGNPSGAPFQLQVANNDFCYVDINPWRIPDGRFFQPTRAFNNQFIFDGTGTKQRKVFDKPNGAGGGDAVYRKYPFYSRRFPVGTAATPSPTFQFQGGTLEIEIYPLVVGDPLNPPAAPSPDTSKPIQRLTVTFPAATLKTPGAGTPFQNLIPSDPSSNGRSWVTNYQVIRSVEPNGEVARGDYRMTSGSAVVLDEARAFGPSGAVGDYANTNIDRVHNFRNGWGRIFDEARFGPLTALSTRRGDKIAKVPAYNGSAVSYDRTTIGDYDRGISKQTDGPFINRPDEGNTRFSPGDNPGGGGHLPYYRGGNGYEEVGETFFSPNRLIASAVMFGSLPTGVHAGRPWETLLFSPPLVPSHKGAQNPPDHYLLDWFNMPVVEPYAISEPLSTAGKINLNSRLAPFGYVKMNGRSYIQRHTGLHGVLKGMKQLVIPNGMAEAGHRETPLSDNSTQVRLDVDPITFTEDIVDDVFDKPDRGYFKSATEICELDLPLKTAYPGGQTRFSGNPSQRKSFWEGNQMTGDNARERPYAHIYPRLTTKSNVYTVHVWAQSIAKAPSTKDDQWDIFDENKDRVLGEYRGSTTIERFIDPNDDALKRIDYDAVTDQNAKGLDPYYRFRIVNQKRFNPQ